MRKSKSIDQVLEIFFLNEATGAEAGEPLPTAT
jgi:hypothetical protein